MMNLVWIGLGGGLGAVLRYLLGGLVQQWTNSASFPYGTLAVNVAGCLLIGLLGQLGEARGLFTPEGRLLVFTGLLGGFTTFSSFGFETLELTRAGLSGPALGNVAANVLLGLGAVWAGRALGLWLWR